MLLNIYKINFLFINLYKFKIFIFDNILIILYFFIIFIKIIYYLKFDYYK